MRIFTTTSIIVVVLLGFTFAYLNAEPVALYYYFGQRTLPLSLLLILFFIMGAFIGLGVGSWRLFRVKRELSRLRRTCAEPVQTHEGKGV
jgi:lipopolysaccharide assembly protein A